MRFSSSVRLSYKFDCPIVFGGKLKLYKYNTEKIHKEKDNAFIEF